MDDRRPFPPSPRRLALARAAGLTAASPLLVGAAAAVAVIVVVTALGRAAATQLGAWIASAADAADGRTAGASVLEPTTGSADVVSRAVAGSSVSIDMLALAVLELALPLIGAAAATAVVVHVSQTRSLWSPRRRIAGAPVLERREVSRAAFDAMRGLVVGAIVVGWLWLTAPELAALVRVPAAAGTAIASLLVAMSIAWIALAVVDALVRRAQLAEALAMTREEKREDDRLAAADPRWRAQRLAVMRGPATSDAVARAAVVVLGDDVAVAIEWDPVRQPVPLRSAIGRRAHATQLVGLARRHRVPVHRDRELAAALATNEGPVPEGQWARLAEIVVAVRGR